MTDIEKVFTFDYKGHRVTIERNRRKDCFLSIDIIDPKPYEKPKIYICNGASFHLTVKSAKNKAIQIIDSFSK